MFIYNFILISLFEDCLSAKINCRNNSNILRFGLSLVTIKKQKYHVSLFQYSWTVNSYALTNPIFKKMLFFENKKREKLEYSTNG